MAEDYANQLDRVRLMASGSLTWDLSENDRAALTAVLDRLHHVETLAARLQGIAAGYGRAMQAAIASAEDEGCDRYRGTDEPREWVKLLRAALEECGKR